MSRVQERKNYRNDYFHTVRWNQKLGKSIVLGSPDPGYHLDQENLECPFGEGVISVLKLCNFEVYQAIFEDTKTRFFGPAGAETIEGAIDLLKEDLKKCR